MFTRRDFLTITAGLSLVGCDSKFFSKSDDVLRICVASDLHYGQKDTDYKSFANDFISTINAFNKKEKIDFLVFNGDLVHDDSKFIKPVRDKFNELNMPYYVTKGNHDAVDEALWKECFNTGFNHEFIVDDDAFLLLNTSDYAGTYLCPDLTWLRDNLEKHRSARNILIFMHINPAGETKFAVECDEILALIASHHNVRAVFNGHDHQEDGAILQKSTPFIFDGHIGGSWGVDYHGFRIIEVRGKDKIITYMMNKDSVVNKTKI